MAQVTSKHLSRTASAVSSSLLSSCIKQGRRSLRYAAAAGPSRQASVVNSHSGRIHENNQTDASSLLTSCKSASLSQPIQEIDDETSGVSIRVYPRTVSVQCSKYGLEDEFHFDHIWLRDICTEAISVQQDTKQKLFHTSDIYIPTSSDSNLGLLNDDKPANIMQSNDALPILQLNYSPKFPVTNAFSATFSSVPPADTKPHTSNIPISILLEHAIPRLYAISHGDIGGIARSWQASDLSSFPKGKKPLAADQIQQSTSLDEENAFARPSRILYSSLVGQQKKALNARFALVDGLMRDGIAFVTELPIDKTGSSIDVRDANSPSLARFAEMLGEIRNTFYGSLWDVRSLGTLSRNIAYTNLDLGLHMDLCYFQNPPRFQFLHMLRNKVIGGASIFVDSYKIAEEMFENHRELWQVLTEVPVGFHYQNDGHYYRYTHPTFELAQETSGHAATSRSSKSGMPRLTAVNYSPPFQSPLPLYPVIGKNGEKLSQFFKALQLFADLTLQERFLYERTLAEGECVIFDNRRVLHSRRGFEWNEGEEKSTDDVKRWLKGCYVDGDAIWSTYRSLLARKQGGKLGMK